MYRDESNFSSHLDRYMRAGITEKKTDKQRLILMRPVFPYWTAILGRWDFSLKLIEIPTAIITCILERGAEIICTKLPRYGVILVLSGYGASPGTREMGRWKGGISISRVGSRNGRIHVINILWYLFWKYKRENIDEKKKKKRKERSTSDRVMRMYAGKIEQHAKASNQPNGVVEFQKRGCEQ